MVDGMLDQWLYVCQERATDTLSSCGNSNTIWCSLQDLAEIKVA